MSWYIAHALRTVYVLLILHELYVGHYLKVVFHAAVLAFLSAIAFVERKDANYAWVDSLFLVLFIGAWFSPVIGVPLKSSVWGPDKLFHFTGGVLLALAAYVFYRSYITNRWVLLFTIVLCSLAIGAAWEVFEYIFFLISPASMPVTFQDTILDLVVDTFGGLCAAIGIWLYKLR